MRACVTGGTGFVGAHIVRALADRDDDVRVVYRNQDRLKALRGVKYRRAKCDVLDYKSMRRALRGIDVLFHVAGNVASNPVQGVWELNAEGPVVAVEAAAAEGVRRVVLTSTISAIGTANGNGPADESTSYPEDWLGLAYPDSKHAGEHAALEAAERHGVELSGVRYPIMVLPTAIKRLARIREAIGLPGALSAEASNLMGQDWRFTSRKARDELGYEARPLDDTLDATIEWYLELIETGAFADSSVSGLSRWADSMRIASRLGLLTPLRVGQRVTGRRIVAGG